MRNRQKFNGRKCRTKNRGLKSTDEKCGIVLAFPENVIINVSKVRCNCCGNQYFDAHNPIKSHILIKTYRQKYRDCIQNTEVRAAG